MPNRGGKGGGKGGGEGGGKGGGKGEGGGREGRREGREGTGKGGREGRCSWGGELVFRQPTASIILEPAENRSLQWERMLVTLPERMLLE